MFKKDLIEIIEGVAVLHYQPNEAVDQIIELVKKEVIGKKYKVRHKKNCFICKTNDIANLLIDEQLERLKG